MTIRNQLFYLSGLQIDIADFILIFEHPLFALLN